MAKNIDFMGATFPDVPSIRLPQHEGGLVSFTDVTDTTAVAGDVAAGKYFYDANGEKTEGTASGGSANIEALSVAQNGTYTASGGVDGYSPVTVNVSGGGSVSVPPKQINFIDYDGTILYSYTSAEWANVSALPDNPTHSGLVAQGWNWTKAQIDTQLTAMPNAPVWVGQMYVTQSGDTEIDVTFVESLRLSPCLSIAPNGTVEIDWGDGSAHDTVTGTSLTTRKPTQHTYEDIGDYTIKLHVVSGTFSLFGASSMNFLHKLSGSLASSYVYSNCAQAVRIGNGAVIGNNAFYNCVTLKTLTIPSGITSIGNYAFYNCDALKCITIPSGITSIGTYVFQHCYALKYISIPNSVTSIGNYAFASCYLLQALTIPNSVTSFGTYMFQVCYDLKHIDIPSGVTKISNYMFQNCYALQTLTIPSGVTSIGNNAFNNCGGMAEYHFKPTTPPTLGSSAFNGIPSDCIIYVPSASLEDYKTATNWSAQASQMQGE